VIFADVLEHMTDPWSALKDWTDRLATGGSVVMSIPNVGHHSALSPLVAGHWHYEDAGIMDRTHLRFFTRETVLELVAGAGLRVIRLERVLNCPWHGVFRNLLRLMVRRQARREPIGGFRQGLRRFLLDYSTFQFLVVAEKP
jgi:2-polyprenyl-3-methyl-5-hydroxy-6-metoxy-1,4-benzoquinol methylase